MTINEKKQLSNYIKGLVQESISELYGDSFKSSVAKPEGMTDDEYFGNDDDHDEEEWRGFNDENGYPSPEDYDEFGSPAGLSDDDEDFTDPYEDEDDKGIMARLHYMMEEMARDAVSQILMEKKGGRGWKNQKSKGKKRKNKKEKTSSRDKTIVNKLNAKGTNAAHYFYELYGVENGTDAEKASARSKGYKKAKGKKNDTGVPYKFTSKEKNRLNSLLTDR